MVLEYGGAVAYTQLVERSYLEEVVDALEGQAALTDPHHLSNTDAILETPSGNVLEASIVREYGEEVQYRIDISWEEGVLEGYYQEGWFDEYSYREEAEAAFKRVVNGVRQPPRPFEPDEGEGRLPGVAGYEGVKEEVWRKVMLPIVNPELADHMDLDEGSGVLLYGPPGTGKTNLAREVGRELETEVGADFRKVDSASLINRYVGESAANVREEFETAREGDGHTLLYFDELDALGTERGDRNQTQERDHAINMLQEELDGLEDRGEVHVLASTNRKDVIDDALLRPGRFDMHVHVPPPDAADREAVFEHYLDERPTAEVDVARLVEETEGYTPAGIEAAIKEAGEHRISAVADELGVGIGALDPAVPDHRDRLKITTDDILAQLDGEDASGEEDTRRSAFE